MKRHAQFFRLDDKGELQEALGSFAVIILDARHTLRVSIAIARNECIKRHYAAFQVRIGERFESCKNANEIERVNNGKA